MLTIAVNYSNLLSWIDMHLPAVGYAFLPKGAAMFFYEDRSRKTGNNDNKMKKATAARSRKLRFEPLENREMLSVTATDFNAIRSQYPDLNLSEEMSDYNIIDITADQLSDAAIRAAIAEAGTTEQNDLIVLRTTETENSITLSGTQLLLDIDATEFGSVTIVSFGDAEMTIDGEQKSRIFEIASAAELSIAGLTIIGGKVTGTGGGFHNSGTLRITDSTISDNTASTSGGGIYNVGASSILTVTNSIISDNKATWGGAIENYGAVEITNTTISGNAATYYGGGIDNSGTLIVLNSTISENTLSSSTSYSYGGGISNSGMLTVTNSTISDNMASATYSSEGGGICNDGGVLMLTNSIISGNTAYSGGGISNCGIFDSYISEATITNCTISENLANTGGGLCNSTDCVLTVTNSTITENTALDDGGGIYSGGILTLAYNIILENTATYYGGGIYTDDHSISTITNCNISKNTASGSGGIHNDHGTLTITNSTIVGNMSTYYGGGISHMNTGTSILLYNTIVVENSGYEDIYSVYRDDEGPVIGFNNLTTFTDWADGSGENRLYDVDLPLFIDAENGDYRLAPHSQAIDWGNNQYAYDAGLNEDSLDLAEAPRIAARMLIIDIGAYEFQKDVYFKELHTVQNRIVYHHTTENTIDEWVFTAEKGQQIQSILFSGNVDSLFFRFLDIDGEPLMDWFRGDSELIPLPYSGTYKLQVFSPVGIVSYSFKIEDNIPTPLMLDIPVQGELLSTGFTKFYKIDVTDSQPLSILLDGYAQGNNVRLYVQYGYAPTMTDYAFVSSGGAVAGQSITIPLTHPGAWYVMLAGEYISTPCEYTLIALSKYLIVDSVSMTRFGNNEPFTVSVSGAGFNTTTALAIIALDGTRYTVQATTLGSSTSIRATFAETVPAGVYKLEVKNGTQTPVIVDDAVTITVDAIAQLEAQIILPSGLRDAGLATLYVEYKNTGNIAMQAPILVLRATCNGEEGARMTLDENRLASGVWISTVPVGYSTSVQIYADGSKPGILLPGETIIMPVYWAGWNTQLSTIGQLDFTLEVLSVDNTEALDFASLKNSLKPDEYTNEAWDVIWPRLQSLMGTTWGDYVKMLSEIAISLEQVGTKQSYGVDELFVVAIQWANDGFSPFGTLITSTDLAVYGPNSVLSFERMFIGTKISSRFYEGDLGFGWDHNWNWKLYVKSNGDVALRGPFGSERLFQVDARRDGTFVSQPGDNGSLKKLANGKYSLGEYNGTVMMFNSDGELETITDTNGNLITATHTGGKLTKLADAYGNSLSIAYNANGKITGVSDNLGNETIYTYDASGTNLVSVTNPQNMSVSYTYATQTSGPLAHTLSAITYADGNVQRFTYDIDGILYKTSLDGMMPISHLGGKTAKDFMKYESFEGTALVQTLWLNAAGQIAKALDTQGRMVIYDYDYYGRVVKMTDETGSFSTLKYDSKGNVVRSQNANGEELRFTYSSKNGNLLTLKDANGNLTTFRYDSRGNLIGMDRADGTSSGLMYNDNGTIAIASNRRGDSYTYTYETSTGQLVETKPSTAEKSIRYEYDERGNLSKITDENDGITTMLYDSHDRLTKITYPSGKSLEYVYDDFGRQTSIKSGSDYHVKYTYNSLGLLETVLDGTQGDALVTRYEYDNLGLLTRETQGNGTYTLYRYDTLGYLLSKINYGNDDSVLSRFDYGYDSAGLLSTMSTLDGQWTYGYDRIGQLTTASFVSTNFEIENQSYVYIYDSNGNRIETVSNGTTIEYVVNNMNQYVKVGDFEYKYDADGNMIEKKNIVSGEVWTFEWCQGNWLRSTTGPDGTWGYEYDAFGNRTAVIHNGQRTEYLIDLSGLGNVIAEYDTEGNLVVGYIHGYGLTSQIDANGNASYYGYDALGSTSTITDAAGAVVNRYVYDPFGQSLLKQELLANPFQYVGEYGTITGQHSELISMRARWYDANTGRFISEDPIGLSGGDVNFYKYANNNVISVVDPSGLASGQIRRRPLKPENSLGQLASHAALSLTWLFIPLDYLNKEIAHEHYFGPNGYNIGYGKDGIMNKENTTSYLPAASSERYYDHEIADEVFGEMKNNPNSEWTKEKYDPITHNCQHFFDDFRKRYDQKVLDKKSAKITGSYDPNEMIGPAGYGDEGYIMADSLLPYRINFENDKTATAAAQRVDIVNQLSDKLDWSTFRLTQFGFGDIIVTVPADASPFYFEDTVSMETSEGTLIDVLFTCELEISSGTLYIAFQSLDPNTLLPPGVLDGFLPPEDETGRGMGFVSYTIKPKSDLQTGDSFNNIARIQFDFGEIIYTNQVDPHDPSQGTDPDLECWLTIDTGAPISSMTPFESPESTSTDFLVSWSGQDDEGGSGISHYDIYVAIDGGEFIKWITTSETDHEYHGSIGHTYSFYCIAFDNVSHKETGLKTTEATITLTEPHIDPPTAIIDNADSIYVQEGCWRLISGSGVDPLGRGLTYLWDFTGEGDFIEHSGNTAWFSAEKLNGKPGATQMIRLKVRDAEGNESEIVNANVSIIDVMPTYFFGYPNPGEMVTGRLAEWEFAAHDVSSDPIMKWLVNWGDGTESVFEDGPRRRIFDSHIYEKSKNYTITITTTDLDEIESTVSFGIFIKPAETIQETEIQPALIPQVFGVKSDEPRILNADSNIPDVSPASTTYEITSALLSASPPADPLSSLIDPLKYAVIMAAEENPTPALRGESTERGAIMTPAHSDAETDIETDAMRLRVMLDLDESGESANGSSPDSHIRSVWEDEDLLNVDWFALDDEPEEADIWSEIFEDDLELLKIEI